MGAQVGTSAEVINVDGGIQGTSTFCSICRMSSAERLARALLSSMKSIEFLLDANAAALAVVILKPAPPEHGLTRPQRIPATHLEGNPAFVQNASVTYRPAYHSEVWRA